MTRQMQSYIQQEIKICFRTSYYWSRGNAFFSGVGELRFKPRAGQIEHSVANRSSKALTAGLPEHKNVKIGSAKSLHFSAYRVSI